MTASVPHDLRNPHRADDADGRKIVPPTIGEVPAEGKTTAR